MKQIIALKEKQIRKEINEKYNNIDRADKNKQNFSIKSSFKNHIKTRN